MSNLDSLIICIPTYKRKWPTILSTIRANQDLTFNMFVREDDYNNGYYNEEQFKLPNLKFIPINNVVCIGTTRDAILQYAINNGYKYCFMIDDTQYGIHDTTNRIKYLSTILENCIERFDEDKFKNKAIAFNFSRKSFVNTYGKTDTYFISQLCQTYILNCDLCKKYNMHFKAMNEVGIEDLDFYIESADRGLITLSDTRFIRIGEHPSIKREGGCHYNMEGKTERDTQNIRADKLMNYIMTNNDIKDKNFLQKVDSVLYPGTYYYKFNTKYAKKKLLNLEDNID